MLSQTPHLRCLHAFDSSELGPIVWHLPVSRLAHYSQQRICIHLFLNGEVGMLVCDLVVSCWRDITANWGSPFTHEVITNKLYRQALFRWVCAFFFYYICIVMKTKGRCGPLSIWIRCSKKARPKMRAAGGSVIVQPLHSAQPRASRAPPLS